MILLCAPSVIGAQEAGGQSRALWGASVIGRHAGLNAGCGTGATRGADCSEAIGALCVTSRRRGGALEAASWAAAGASCDAGFVDVLVLDALSALMIQPTSSKLATARAFFGRISGRYLLSWAVRRTATPAAKDA